MTAGLYIRVSTEQQVEKESLQTQESRLRAYCEANKLTVHQVYRDEGLSAKDTKREALQELLADIKSQSIQIVVVTRLDRITRSLRDLLSLLETFHEHDVKFISLADSIDTTGPMGRFMLNLLGSFAQLERETVAQRVAEVMHHRAAQGKWNGGVIPFGYTTQQRVLNDLTRSGISKAEATALAAEQCPQPKTLYVDPDEAETVKKIYSTYLKVKSARGTVQRLNAAGCRTRRQALWATSSITRILSNPVYIGKMPYGRRKTDLPSGEIKRASDDNYKVADGHHEPIISQEQFEIVQDVLADSSLKRTRSARTYLLSRLLRCGKCGAPMYGHAYAKRSGHEYFYYRCHGRWGDHPNACQGLTIPGDRLEEFVVDTLSELSQDHNFLNDKEKMLRVLTEEAEPDQSKAAAELDKLKAAERELTSRRDTLLDSLEMNVIEPEVFAERYEKIKNLLDQNRLMQAEVQTLTENLDVREAALQASFESIASFTNNWELLDEEGKAAMLQTIVKQITLTEDDMHMEIFLDSPESGEVAEVSHTGRGSSRRSVESGRGRSGSAGRGRWSRCHLRAAGAAPPGRRGGTRATRRGRAHRCGLG